MLRIGIDLDNTIIAYDRVFAEAARERGLVDDGAGKADVRAALRRRDGGEQEWQRLQGWVYGAGIGGAVPFDGVRDFLLAGSRAGAELFIISHKTEYGHFDPDRINLRDAALGWLERNCLLGEGPGQIPRGRISFGATRDEKLGLLAGLGLNHFIDDLAEVLTDPGFPDGIRRHLFLPGEAPPPTGPFLVHRAWHDIVRSIFPAA